MGDASPLLALKINPDAIWGNDSRTTVFAQVLSDGRPVIFSFGPRHKPVFYRPKALQSRVPSCYYNESVSDESFSYRDQDDMRSAMWSAIATVWPKCVTYATTFEPGSVVDLTSSEDGEIHWKPTRSTFWGRYVNTFRDVQPSDLVPQYNAPHTVDISELALLEHTGELARCCRRVRIRPNVEESPMYIFKGIDFTTYLQVRDNDGLVECMLNAWLRSTKLIARAPPHPNIQAPPTTLVSVFRQPSVGSYAGKVLMGHLMPCSAIRKLDNFIAAANSGGKEILLRQKAKWCQQMASAVVHTHRVMNTFHMDIRPESFMVDDETNLVLIDWEQLGSRAITLAPEADGTATVEEREVEGVLEATQLIYVKHPGPDRRNLPKGSGNQSYSTWSVFSIWHRACPRATELAEVFSLGRTLWMLLTQTIDGFDNVEHPDDVEIT